MVLQAFIYGDPFRSQLVAIVVPDPEVRSCPHGSYLHGSYLHGFVGFGNDIMNNGHSLSQLSPLRAHRCRLLTASSRAMHKGCDLLLVKIFPGCGLHMVKSSNICMGHSPLMQLLLTQHSNNTALLPYRPLPRAFPCLSLSGGGALGQGARPGH